jgi:hypothetical protein
MFRLNPRLRLMVEEKTKKTGRGRGHHSKNRV